MSEFSAAADLEVTVTQDSLRSARRQIERDLGDVEVGVSGSAAPDGGGRTGVGRGQRAGILDASRQTLGATESLVDLAEVRNELLEDIADAGGVGGGDGGGGAGAGQTVLQVAGAQSVLGGIGGAAGGAAAGARALGPMAALAGLPLAGGMVGQAGADLIDKAFPDARGETGIAGTQFSEEGLFGETEPILQVPDDFPPELQVPDIPESIGLNVPQGLRDALNLDVNLNLDSKVQFTGMERDFIEQHGRGPRFEQEAAEEQRRVESLMRSELQRFEQRLKRELGGGSGSRTHGPTTSTGL